MSAHVWFGNITPSETTLVSALATTGNKSSATFAQTASSDFSAMLQQTIAQPEAEVDQEQQETMPVLSAKLDDLLEQLLASEEWTEEEWNALADLLTIIFASETSEEAYSWPASEKFDALVQKASQFRQLAAIIAVHDSVPAMKRLAELLANGRAVNALEGSAQTEERPHGEMQMTSGRAAVNGMEDQQTSRRMATELAQLMRNLAENPQGTWKAIHGDEWANRGEKHERFTSFRPIIAPYGIGLSEEGAEVLKNESAALQRIAWTSVQAQSSSENAADSSGHRESMRAFVPVQTVDSAGQFQADKADAALRQNFAQGMEHQASISAHESAKAEPSAPENSSTRPGYMTVRAENWAEEMSRMMLKMQTSRGDGMSEVRIKLVPDHLGHVDVHLKLHKGQLTAQFIADKLAGKEVLESQIALLRTALQNQGLQVEKIEVTHQPTQQQHGMLHDEKPADCWRLPAETIAIRGTEMDGR